MRTFILTLLVLLPLTGQAAVVINEVAWMGTAVNVNDEWLELYNTGGDAVVLDGWVLSDNVALDIPLTGILGGGEYAVLERTDDSTAPGTAFLIYTGALSNDGRTLTLRRADGSVEDQVAGGANWENIGGNNETKDTAQRTSGGWITAAPTPGAENASIGTNTGNEDDDDDDSSSTTGNTSNSTKPVAKPNGSSGSSVPFRPSTAELILALDAPKTAYVNQPVELTVTPRGIGETIMNSLTYTWNFGDAMSATGAKKMTHTYRYPGTYVVVVNATFARHDALARKIVTVLPVTLTLERTASGDILIHNEAPYEVDLSGFTLVGDHSLAIPENTILLENGTLTVERSRVEDGVHKMLALYDPKRVQQATLMPSSLTSAAVIFAEAPRGPVTFRKEAGTERVVPLTKQDGSPEIGLTSPEGEIPLEPLVIPIGNRNIASPDTAIPNSFKEMFPYIGFVLLLALAALVLLLRRVTSEKL